MNKRSEQILEVIKTYMAEHEYAPTISEIGTIIGIPACLVNQSLEYLEETGYISRDRRLSRAMFVLPKGHS